VIETHSGNLVGRAITEFKWTTYYIEAGRGAIQLEKLTDAELFRNELQAYLLP